MHTAERELHAACERGDVFACVTLLQRGVAVNCRDRHSEATPLIRAVHCNQVEIVNVLMQRREELGCDIYQFDKQGFAGFHWAVMSGNVDIVSLMMFLDRSLLTRPDASGRTPYYLCTLLRPNPEVIHFLKQFYPEECRIIEEKQCAENGLVKGEIVYSRGSKRSKKIYGSYGTIIQRLTTISTFLISSCGKNSAIVQKFPFYCFFMSLCISTMYTVLFMSSMTSAGASIIWLKILNVVGHIFIWFTFYKTYNAIPIHLPVNLFLQFGDVIRNKSYDERMSVSSAVCYRCRIVQTSRIGHCRHSKRCLINYDHFCLFLWSSIHSTNYLFFFSYLVSMFSTMPIFMHILIQYIHCTVRAQGVNSVHVTARPWTELIRQSPSVEVRMAVTYLLWVLLMWMFVFSLIGYHVQSIYRGQTSRERSRGSPLPQDGEHTTYRNVSTKLLSNLLELSTDVLYSETHSNLTII